MNIRQALIATLMATATIASPAPVIGQTLDVQRFGLYVLVDDVDRSVAFYEALFGEEPQIRTTALVGFDIAEGFFGIVNRHAYGADTVGARSGVRPYIRVKDIDAAFARVLRLPTAQIEPPGIVSEGPFRFFRFADPDGNSVEIFSFAPAS